MAYTTYPLILFTAGAANTKGAYTQIVASTPYASSRLTVMFASSTAGRFLLMDIATGSAGAEAVVVSNIALAVDTDSLFGSHLVIDVDIPAGTRVAARIQCVTAATTANATFLLENRPLGSLANPVTYGADPANSRGTQVDPGATINTKGSYVQLSGSTSARIDAIALCLTTAAQGTNITATTAWQVDLATGPAGTETVMLPDVNPLANVGTDAVRPGTIRFAVPIPAGTRLAVRCQSIVNTATLRLLCVTAIGMQEPATGSAGAGPAAVAYVG